MKIKRIKNYYPLIKKDIFEEIELKFSGGNYGSTVIVPHICNNVNLFSAGFAGQVAIKYPVVKENFHMLGNKVKLGHVQYVKIKKDKTYRHELIFANMIAQNRVIGSQNYRPLNYEALIYCMADVRNFINNFSFQDSGKIEIHCPKFGCGLAGGNWDFIYELIKDCWKNIPTFIYEKIS